ncbi:MAG TPA: M14 family metallopeptidase [Chitinophagaceae bacterium]|nr:M14 family metallopeptidase [Chitinophagaceae bacterium]
MRFSSFLLFITFSIIASAQKTTTRFEQSGGTESPTYAEIISWWQKLDARSALVKMQAMGQTDAGFPLHVILVSGDGDFDIASLKRKGRTLIFINNGIHPGEPDGIDASMLLVRDLVEKKQLLPQNVVLAIIPVYNIGGALNRSKNYRIDQAGPVEKGFRGNAQNLDLNRDFIKMDSKEAVSFTKIYHWLDPDIFVDNHVSNGADYQPVMTLLTTQHNKLGGAMGAYLNNEFDPALYQLMKEKGLDMVPYVNHGEDTPDKGWIQFWDSPRYSSGYATLWNTFAFTPETHMLKSYAQRVNATYSLMQSFIAFGAKNSRRITQLRNETKKAQQAQDSFTIAWKHDPNAHTNILFKGYEAGYKKSDVSGLSRLYYDRNKPFEKEVPFYNVYVDSIRVATPKAYIIPQGWWKVIERLQAAGVTMQPLKKDTTIPVESYRIEKYQSYPRPFEGHHVNYGVQLLKTTKEVSFRKGDYLIPLNQAANRFLIETLEPQGEDSYFAWNFFDAILQQKEGFSDYVFEETAATFLKTHPDVNEALQKRRQTDSAFAKNGAAQLDFIFKQSPYYEPAHLQYPVYRLVR